MHLIRRDRVLFVERSGELAAAGKVKHLRCGAEGKPSLKRAKSQRTQTEPGDLPMSRMKLP